MKQPIRIIILEDHPMFRLGLRGALAASPQTPPDSVIAGPPDFTIVGEAASVAAFFSLQTLPEADIILLDIILPDGSGIDVARRIRETPELKDKKILVLSSETSEETIKTLMDIGIDGFISKNSPDEELRHAIKDIYDGYDYFGQDITRTIRLIRESRPDIPDTSFTDKELEVIRYCVQGLPAKQIAYKMQITPGTVNVHKYNIFQKLGINSTLEMVRYAMQKGLLAAHPW